MPLAPEMAAIATELIAEYGAAVTFTRVSGKSYNPATGQSSAGAPQTMTPNCLTENKGLWLGKELGVMGEKKLTLSAEGLSFTPAPGDKFSHGGKTYSIIERGVVATEIEGTPVLYEVYGVSGG